MATIAPAASPVSESAEKQLHSATTIMSRQAKALKNGRLELYTSFEDNSLINVSYQSRPIHAQARGRRYSPPPNKDQVETKQLTIDEHSTVTFYGREHFLSCFHNAPFVINGHQYPTVEHYYEACKVYGLVGAEWARSLKDIPDPGAVKSASKRMLLHLPRSKVDKWRMTDGILVTKVAMVEKFRQNPDLGQKLLETGDKLLVQCNRSDQLWSAGFDEAYFKRWLSENQGKTFDVPLEVTPEVIGNFPKIGKGRNLQGFIIMNVRGQLKREPISAQSDSASDVVVGGTGPGIGSESDEVQTRSAVTKPDNANPSSEVSSKEPCDGSDAGVVDKSSSET